MKPFSNIDNVLEIRMKTDLNQTDFWGAIGTTQSGGSRYESGRNMPNAVRELVRIVYVEKMPLEKIKRKNFKGES